MRIEQCVNYVTSLGPGKRLCIWVNGCSRRCRGCMSSHLQAVDPSVEVCIEEYLAEFNLLRIDGVTISGGEPFEQTAELVHLLTYCRQNGIRDILVYTGFTLEELLKRKDPDTEKALSLISVLVDGPYVEEKNFGTDNIKGSANQRVILLDKTLEKTYHNYMGDERAMQEFLLGSVLLGVGIPPDGYIEAFNSRKKA